MLRRVPKLRVLIALALGCMTTVAVCWTVALGWWGTTRSRQLHFDGRAAWNTSSGPHPYSAIEAMYYPSAEAHWRVRHPDWFTYPPDWSPSMIVPPAYLPVAPVEELDLPAWSAGIPGDGRVSLIRGFGWPLIAMYCVSKAFGVPEPTVRLPRGLFARDEFELIPNLPIGIVPAGFIVNSAAFGLAWLGIVTVAIGCVRRARARIDHCPNCDYSLAGLARGAPCPECGKSGA